MANIKSQKKRNITNEKARMRNRAVKSELKTATRRVKDAVADNDEAKAYAEALAACRLLDKAVSKGVIHKNQAANRKHGIMALVNPIVSDDGRAAYTKPERKQPTATGSKKAARKEERAAEQKKANEEKAKRVAAQAKLEEKANKRKAKEAEEAAKAEAEAAAAAEAEAEAEAEEAPAEEAPAEEEAAE